MLQSESGEHRPPSSPPRVSDLPAYGAPLNCYMNDEFPGFRQAPLTTPTSAFSHTRNSVPSTVTGPLSPPDSFGSLLFNRPPIADWRPRDCETQSVSDYPCTRSPKSTVSPHIVGASPYEHNRSSMSLPLGPSRVPVSMSPLLTQQPPRSCGLVSPLWPPASNDPISNSGDTNIKSIPHKKSVESSWSAPSSNCRTVALVAFVGIQVLCLAHLHSQSREISRLEYTNQQLLSAQAEIKQSCAVSLGNVRAEMQSKCDAVTATASRIHQLELDK